jgi:hypothetical protein
MVPGLCCARVSRRSIWQEQPGPRHRGAGVRVRGESSCGGRSGHAAGSVMFRAGNGEIAHVKSADIAVASALGQAAASRAVFKKPVVFLRDSKVHGGVRTTSDDRKSASCFFLATNEPAAQKHTIFSEKRSIARRCRSTRSEGSGRTVSRRSRPFPSHRADFLK